MHDLIPKELDMARIISLETAAGASALSMERKAPEKSHGSQEAAPASAEIILFPGVRYERWDDDQSASSNVETTTSFAKADKDSRDWLQI